MNDQEIRDRALSAALELLRGQCWNAADLLKCAREIEQYLRGESKGEPQRKAA